MRNNKGFTLIELMIAIAIIGILALVLIPKVSGLKDTAKESGLDASVRTALAIAESIVDSYPATAQGAHDLEAALATKLGASGVENPFTQDTTVNETGAADPSVGDCAFIYTDDLGGAPDEDGEETFVGDTDYLGAVLFDAYVDGGVKVKFTPCDKDGNLLTAKSQTTN